MGRRLIVYLDTCCYGRPFDLPQTPQKRAEAAAIDDILKKRERGELRIIGSTVTSFEIGQITDAERERLWAESKDDDEFTEKAIAFGKLTGELAIDRYILPQPTRSELREAMERIATENPGRYKTPEQVRGAS